MKRILIKYATRGRRELFLNTLKNIQETVSNENQIYIAVSIDRDDSSMEMIEDIFGCSFYLGSSLNKVHAINRDMPAITESFDWDLLINMSDDMKFVQQDWDVKMIEQIKSVWPDTTDFFAHFNDGYVGEKLPTMSIMGREYYERFFYIYPPCYKSFSCDAEAMFVAQMLGRWHYFPEVLFKHEHPANTTAAAYDRTYEEASKHGDHDVQVYFKRMRKLFYVNNPVMIPEPMRKELGLE